MKLNRRQSTLLTSPHEQQDYNDDDDDLLFLPEGALSKEHGRMMVATRDFRLKIWKVYLATYLATIVVLLFLWIFGWTRKGLETLSEIIATDSLIQSLFVSWVTLYIVLCSLLTLPLIFEPLWKTKKKHSCEHKVHDVLKVLIIFFTVTKFLGLILLIIFPVTTKKLEHYIFTGVGFFSAVALTELRLVNRRITQVLEPQEDEDPQELKEEDCLFWGNVAYVIVELAVAITFVVSVVKGPTEFAGVSEFVLTLMVMTDRIWDMLEYSRNSIDVKFISKLAAKHFTVDEPPPNKQG